MQGATLLAQCVCSATAMPWWPARRHVGACLLSGLPKQCSLSPDATCSPLPAFLPLSSICPPLPFSSRPFGSAHAGSVENAAKAFLAIACYLTVRRHARSLQGRVVDFLLSPGLPAIPSPHISHPPQAFPISVFLMPVAWGALCRSPQQLYRFLNNLHSRPPNHGSKNREGAVVIRSSEG